MRKYEKAPPGARGTPGNLLVHTPFRERFEAVLEGINQQLPSERYSQIIFDISSSDESAEGKPEHLLQAMQRLVRFGQGVQEMGTESSGYERHTRLHAAAVHTLFATWSLVFSTLSAFGARNPRLPMHSV